MKTKIRKIISVLLVLVLVGSIAPLSTVADFDWSSLFATKVKAAETLAPTGQCGENVYWSFDESAGLLTISGMGAIYNYYNDVSPFYENESIKKVVIEDGVTRIGDGTFLGCKQLTDIDIPNSVAVIEHEAFCGCESLVSINIPNGIISIGSHVFAYCINLNSITIPESVTNIGSNVFDNCAGLTSIDVDENNTCYCSDKYGVLFDKDKTELIQYPSGNTRTSYCIPDSVTSIGDSAFSNCRSLTGITIPDSVTSIGAMAFYDCTGLTSIIIPESVISIGYFAFYNCSSLTGITIPESVTSIGYFAFYNCSSLTSITIPDSVTSIGDDAFGWCSGLTSVTIPDSVTSIGDHAFENCSSLTNIDVDENNKCYCSDKYGVLFDKDKTELIQYPSGNTRTSYCIPDSVTSIGDSAFFYCSSLTGITIPESVTSIDEMAFYRCTGLTSIIIPESVTSIGDYAFTDCRGLTGITIPDSVTSIGDSSFAGCTGLTSITIPDSVTAIENYAFGNCSSLTSITIPESVTYISNDLFYNCFSLTSITIPDSVTSIGDYAFWNCRGLTSITIPNSVTSIGDGAFRQCQNLTNINIPEHISSVGNLVFYQCNSLTDITIPDSVIIIGDNAFSECRRLTSLVIPDSVTSISETAFRYCYNISDVFYEGTPDEWNELNVVLDSSEVYIHYGVSAEEVSDHLIVELIEEPGCEYSGVEQVSCSCGYSHTRYVPAKGHILGEALENHEPTCTTDGYTVHYCNRCEQYVKQYYTGPLGHNFENDVCTRCGAKCLTSDIGLNELKQVNITNVGDEMLFRFVPAESGKYYFFSDSLYDTYGYIYNSEMEVLFQNDDYDGEANFMMEYYFDAGETYYLKGRFYSNTNTGSFYIGLTDTFTSCHACEDIETVEPTCEYEGYTLFRCSRCGYRGTKDRVDALGHNFVDYVCTRCGCTINIIGLNESKKVNAGESAVFSFSPTEDGTYYFFTDSISNRDISINLYDSDMKNLNGEIHLSGGWKKNDGKTIIKFKLYAGNTYYIKTVDSISFVKDYCYYVCVSDSFTSTHNWLEFEGSVSPCCVDRGYDIYSCSICGKKIEQNYVPAIGHSFENDICKNCGLSTADAIESDNPVHGMQEFIVYKPGAKRIAITFSKDTKLYGNDYEGSLILLNSNGECLESFSYESDLGGKRITVTGDTVKIRVTDAYFALTDVTAYYNNCREHINTEVRDRIESSCYSYGFSGDVYCIDCGMQLESGKWIQPHYNTKEVIEVIEPTCKQGYTKYRCTECGEEFIADYTDSVSEHTKSELIEKLEPTCCECGYSIYRCSVCGEEYYTDWADTIPHIKSELIEIVDPTCYEDGYSIYRCSACGREFYDDWTYASHTKGDLIETVEPTCYEDGYSIYRCSVCGEEFYDDWIYASHTKGDLIETVEPTCVDFGYSLYYCSECGKSFKTDYLDPLWHSKDKTVAVINPTCMEYGYTVYHCNVCGCDYEDDYIDALGHDFENDICTRCGYEIQNINLEEMKSVQLNNYSSEFFKFVPEKSGEYYFYSLGKSDTLGFIYDEDMNEIAYDDDRGSFYNFEICRDFEAGKTYYLEVRTYSGENGNFTFTVSKSHIENIVPNPGTKTVIDNDSMYIYGIESGLSEWTIRDYFSIPEKYDYMYQYENCIGTGSTLTLYSYDDETETEYTFILFGDVNGDGWYDGTDSVIVNCLASGILSKDHVSEAAWIAADCNHDGAINSDDVALLEQAGLILSSVDQTKSQAELMEDAAYVEYLSLIDQSPAKENSVDDTKDNEADKAETSTEKSNTASTDKTEEKPVNETVSRSFIQRIIDFISYLFKMMKSFIPKF